MAGAVSDIVSAAGWKLRVILRTRRFYSDADLVLFCKAHLLSFLEYRTPAIYHATRAVLSRLDAVQSRFLRDIGVDDISALVTFRLAPLATRRDIAMLGLIHRTILGKGPSQFSAFFQCDAQNSRKLIDPRRTCKCPLISRSALGLVAIYNMLPISVTCEKSVSVFQKRLQDIVVSLATAGHPQWVQVFSPRLPLASHPLKSCS